MVTMPVAMSTSTDAHVRRLRPSAHRCLEVERRIETVTDGVGQGERGQIRRTGDLGERAPLVR